jgi:hypothetical protein
VNVVRLVDLCKTNDCVEGIELHNTLILGPAVVALVEDVSITGTNFGCDFADLDALFIEVPEGKVVTGVIGLRHVRFVDCRLQAIAFLGTRETLAVIRSGIAPPVATAVQGSTPAPAFWGHLIRDEVLPNEVDGQTS